MTGVESWGDGITRLVSPTSIIWMYIAAGADVEVDSSTGGVVEVVDPSMGGAVEVDSYAWEMLLA